MDTVFDPGTAAERPFRIHDGVAYGPGVTDMKSGLLAGLLRAEGVDRRARRPCRSSGSCSSANPDEEIGSPTSTPHIREVAADADVALVLECARANGDIVSARKGILDLRITVHGRAAHAGVEPEKGRSAILEAARIVRDLHGLNGRWPDVTVNVGVIAGGTRPNVVAERCPLEVDVRAVERSALEVAEAEIRRIAAATEVPDTTVDFEAMARLVADGEARTQRPARRARAGASRRRLASTLARCLHGRGVRREHDGRAWASASLDGLGPIGGNDHAPAEYLEVDSIVPRTTLLAGLLLAIAADPEVLAWRDDASADACLSGSGSRPAGRGRRSPATAARSSSATACWVAGTTDAGADGRSRHPGRRRGPGAGGPRRSSRRRWPRPASR